MNTEVPGSTLAFRKKPDVIAMLQQIDSDRAKAKAMMQESEPMSGRPRRLSPTMLPMLKERVATLNTLSGFTAVSVKFAVAELIRETLELKDDDDDDPSWLPSEEWCYWFLHKEMNLTMCRTSCFMDLITLMRMRIFLRMRMTSTPTLMILVIIKYTLNVTLGDMCKSTRLLP